MEEGALIQFQTVLVMIQVLEPAHLARLIQLSMTEMIQ